MPLTHNHTKFDECDETCPVLIFKQEKVNDLLSVTNGAPFLTPEKQEFVYYLHNDYNSYEMREFLEEKGIVLSEAAWENLGNPFYEITLKCEVDSNGNVTILGAK